MKFEIFINEKVYKFERDDFPRLEAPKSNLDLDLHFASIRNHERLHRRTVVIKQLCEEVLQKYYCDCYERDVSEDARMTIIISNSEEESIFSVNITATVDVSYEFSFE